MPIAAADLMSRAGEILQDNEHIRWTVPELLQWINDAAAATIVGRPSARSITKAIPLKGGTLQRIPARSVQLLDVVRNMGADGTKPGRSIRRIDRQLLDDQAPDWHAGRQKPAIKHFMFDERTPQEFYVYPPAIDGTQIELVYSELPPVVADVGDTLDMNEEYTSILVNYLCYRALSKDSEFANGQIATLHYQAFADAVGISAQQVTANSPNAGASV